MERDSVSALDRSKCVVNRRAGIREQMHKDFQSSKARQSYHQGFISAESGTWAGFWLVHPSIGPKLEACVRNDGTIELAHG